MQCETLADEQSKRMTGSSSRMIVKASRGVSPKEFARPKKARKASLNFQEASSVLGRQ
jgi:hypothetical protein